MSVVSVGDTFAASVPDADRLWCDTTRWPRWVEGLETVSEVSATWPQPGSEVRWSSGPAGRGAVTERVTARDALSVIATAVSDASIEGEQIVRFTPVGDRVRVDLTLEYRLRSRSVLMRVVDPLFIRRAMRRSLADTLSRFGAELEATASPPP